MLHTLKAVTATGIRETHNIYSILIHISYYTFSCVVSLSIFTSCAVFWRARRASQNTNE